VRRSRHIWRCPSRPGDLFDAGGPGLALSPQDAERVDSIWRRLLRGLRATEHREREGAVTRELVAQDHELLLIEKDAKRVDSIWRRLQGNHLTRSTNAQLVVAENSGHYVYISEPALVVDAIRDLALDEVGTAQAIRLTREA